MKKRKITIWLSFLILLTAFISQTAAQTKTAPKTAEKPLPNLVLNRIDGEKWSLYENRGRIVLINFWATWCEPCRTETPMLVELGGEYKQRGLEIVGIALDENPGLIKKFTAEYKIDYPILLPVPGSALARIDPVPTTLLIDSEARLVKKYVGALPEKILREDVKKLIEELNFNTGAAK
jgi:cytochrome c biogenesis protein CcmG, thiol:disulfide interchange protein DsbE